MLMLMASGAMPLTAQQHSIFDRIEEMELRETELAIDIAELLSRRLSNERVPATVTFRGHDIPEESWDATVNVRGNFRRMRCDFPPLRLNFVKKDLRQMDMMTHNNIKIVTPCYHDKRSENYVLAEYIVYEMYQTLTEQSFRVALTPIHYRDIRKQKSFSTYAFFIEDEDDMLERLDGEACDDCYSYPLDSFRREDLALLGLFQYFIGNMDWSTATLRNLKMMRSRHDGKYMLIPYDFDFTGFVNAHYVPIPQHLGIANVRERVYLGFNHDRATLEKALDILRARRADMERHITECPYLDKSAQRDLLKYVQSFFRKMSGKNAVDRFRRPE
jgi:hypothetical protein